MAESQYANGLDFGGMCTDEVGFAWLCIAFLVGPESAAMSSGNLAQDLLVLWHS